MERYRLLHYYGVCWLLTASFTPWLLYVKLITMSVRPPQIRALSFHLIPTSFTPTVPNSYRALVCLATLPTIICLGMKFLSVRPDVCRRLLSDSISRWTPLPLAVWFPLLGLTRDLHPLDNAHAEHTKKWLIHYEPAINLMSKLIINTE